MFGKSAGAGGGAGPADERVVLVGQHGVYCRSQRNPTLPTMDIRMITQELVHAKELVQSVMERFGWRRKRE